MTRRVCALLIMAVCLAVSACQDGPPGPRRYPVSGSVTLNGKPLDKGFVYFKTIASGAIECIDVKEGKFSGKAEPGDRRVEIDAFTSKTETFNGMTSETKTNLIPVRYNRESELTGKVTPAGPNEFNFELKSE